MDLRNIEPTIFSADLQREIDTNIMAPIRFPDAVRAAGTPLKRGVLMAGRYGVGKTLLSANVAKEATENGWTFLYCEDVRELPDALQFATAYQPCVIFAEDVDRVTAGDRTSELDEILNQIDGIGTKGAEILTILTTNAVEKIHPAMLRPGRIDVPLFVDPPDPDAVIQLVRMYGRDLIGEGEDLSEVGAVLQGRIPAVIREVVERSKLENISRTKGKGGKVSAEDITAAARTYLKAEERLQPPQAADGASTMEAFGRGMGEAIAVPIAQFLQKPQVVPHSNGHLSGSVTSIVPASEGSQRTV